MAENKEPRDEKLIEELYERLWWYTYEAGEEEFDEKEVDAITRLLDVLEPVHDDRAYEPGADAALKRFWERYGEEEEMEEENATASSEPAAFLSGESVAGKDGAEPRKLPAEETPAKEMPAAETAAAKTVKMPKTSRTSRTSETSAKPGRGSKWRKRLIRAAIGAAACAVLLVSVNVGSYALRKKSFFEIVREGMGRTEITVTGNTEGIESTTDEGLECSSWTEAEELIGENILEPTFIPEEYELKSLLLQNSDVRKVIVGRYENVNGNFIKFRVNIYQEEYKKDVIQYGTDWYILSEELSDLNVQFYRKEDMYEAFFSEGKCTYSIITNDQIETLKKIVVGMIETK